MSDAPEPDNGIGPNGMPRIAIAFPTRDLCAAPFAKALCDLVSHFTLNFVATGQAELIPSYDMGSLLPDMRNRLAEHAIDNGCTHILWLDNDMTFPFDALERLFLHERPIVGASYSTRIDPAFPVNGRLNGDAGANERIYTTSEASGLEEVDYTGMGCLLVATDVYRFLPKPWHMIGWNEAEQRCIGEDAYFCRKARSIGASTYIDHDLSKEIGHVGARVFTVQDAVAAKDAYLARRMAELAKQKAATDPIKESAA